MKPAAQLEQGEVMTSAMHEATDIIKAEHRALAAVINALKFLVTEVRAKRIDPDFKLLWSMLYYIEAFPEKLHHPKEDGYLFAMLRQRTHDGDSLLDELERQHRVGEERVRDLQVALGHFVAGKADGLDTFAGAVERFADFTWKHMSSEEREVFPLAQKHLTPADWKAIDKAFQQNQDPLTGVASGADLEFRRLFTEIVNLVPAPLGLGASPR
jgi:hemerythrin-like domain-containing protein